MTLLCSCTLVIDIPNYEEVKTLVCPRCELKGAWRRLN